MNIRPFCPYANATASFGNKNKGQKTQQTNFDKTYLPNKNDIKKSPFDSSVNISKKLRNIFGTTNSQNILGLINSDIKKLQVGIVNNKKGMTKEAVGDILFKTAQIAEMEGIDPEKALEETNQKLINRAQAMQKLSKTPLNENSREDNYFLWCQVKGK